MPSVALIQILSGFGAALVAFKLHATGLRRRYPVFFAFTIYLVPLLLTAAFIGSTSSGSYFFYFLCTQPIGWFFYVAVVLELFKLILERHKGFNTFGRLFICAALAVSILVSALTLLPEITPRMPQLSRAVMYYIAVERGLDLSLALLLLLVFGFLNLYAVPLSRNLVLHTFIYTFFFLSNTAAMLLRTVFGLENAESLNLTLAVLSLACLMAWFFLLSAKGEQARFRLPWFDAAQEEHILRTMDSLNATLLRVSGK